MSDKFSPSWWNEQAGLAGLDKSAVEFLTGMLFPTVWNSDGTIDWDKAWPKNAMLSAPGLAASGLLLSPSMQPSSYPYKSAQEAFAANDPNWGGWAKLVSPMGVVAPGASDPYNPELSTVYVAVSTPTVPPTTSGAIPPGPTSNIPEVYGPTTMPVKPVTTFVEPVPATGGQGAGGTVIPQIAPQGPAQPLPTVTITATQPKPPNVWMIAAVVLVLVLLFSGKGD